MHHRTVSAGIMGLWAVLFLGTDSPPQPSAAAENPSLLTRDFAMPGATVRRVTGISVLSVAAPVPGSMFQNATVAGPTRGGERGPTEAPASPVASTAAGSRAGAAPTAAAPDPATIAQAIRTFFVRAEVVFPPGATVTYEGAAGLIYVTNTERELERITNVLRRYSDVKQVTIEARLVDLPQELTDLDRISDGYKLQRFLEDTRELKIQSAPKNTVLSGKNAAVEIGPLIMDAAPAVNARDEIEYRLTFKDRPATAGSAPGPMAFPALKTADLATSGTVLDGATVALPLGPTTPGRKAVLLVTFNLISPGCGPSRPALEKGSLFENPTTVTPERARTSR